MCSTWQLSVPLNGFTCSDQRQPGSNVPRPIMCPFRSTSSTLPLPPSNSRTSSGESKPLPLISAIAPPSQSDSPTASEFDRSGAPRSNHRSGYTHGMTVQEKAKDIVHSVEHPVEAAKSLEREAELGKSARTPLIALTGVTLVVFVLLAIMLAIVMTLYFVYGGH